MSSEGAKAWLNVSFLGNTPRMAAGRWFGVRTVYEHEDRARGRERLYEERIVLVRADSQDEALVEAEKEAEAYATSLTRTRYLGFAVGFELFDEPGENTEVFSLMRDSRLDPGPYIDRFFDTGRERTC